MRRTLSKVSPLETSAEVRLHGISPVRNSPHQFVTISRAVRMAGRNGKSSWTLRCCHHHVLTVVLSSATFVADEVHSKASSSSSGVHNSCRLHVATLGGQGVGCSKPLPESCMQMQVRRLCIKSEDAWVARCAKAVSFLASMSYSRIFGCCETVSCCHRACHAVCDSIIITSLCTSIICNTSICNSTLCNTVICNTIICNISD